MNDASARAAWSALAEPGDVVAGTLVEHLGASDALGWVSTAAVDGVSSAHWGRLEERCGALAPALRARVARAVARWAGRMAELDPERSQDHLERLGGALLVPSDPRWPSVLDDLGTEAPFCLWVRGTADLRALLDRSVSVVGSRAATTYGERIAFDLAHGLTGRGTCVVSGGAYGIDAAAHRGAVANDGATVVVLAGGVDRPYPAGNARLLEAAVASGGALVAEVPPGSLPTRSRFLQRNRLIAAAGGATVVVEAAWRSGAMSTANHAAGLLRPVGAVPGTRDVDGVRWMSSAAPCGHRGVRDRRRRGGRACRMVRSRRVARRAGSGGSGRASPGRPRSAGAPCARCPAPSGAGGGGPGRGRSRALDGGGGRRARVARASWMGSSPGQSVESVGDVRIVGSDRCPGGAP